VAKALGSSMAVATACMSPRLIPLLGLGLIAFLLLPSADATAQQSCELRTKGQLETVLSDATQTRGITAAFRKPVLPRGERVRLVVDEPFTRWQAERICAVILWNAEPGECGPGRSEVCSTIPNVTAHGDPDDPDITHLRFTVPRDAGVDGRPPLRQPLEIRMVAYGTDGEPVFTFRDRLWASGAEWSLAVALISVFGAYALLAAMAGSANPVQLTAGVYGKASLSRLQVFGFTLLVGGMVIYSWCRTGLILEISEDLLLLMGISAAGAAGGKLTAVRKKRPRADVRAYLARKRWLREASASGEPARVADLVLTDNRLNVYKMQMAVFSVIVAVVLLTAGIGESGVIDIPDTYLALIGLGQGVYVAGKAISESDIADFETRIQNLRDKEQTYLGTQGAVLPTPGTTWPAFRSAALDSPARTAFQAYETAVEEARTLVTELYGIRIEDDRLLPVV